MPGKHVPPGPLASINDFLGAVPPTNGYIHDHNSSNNESSSFQSGYRIYISGDTLMVDELKSIPERYTDSDQAIDFMLIHLGGTTIPSPSFPLLMVTMDAQQGVQLMQLIKPDITIPVHSDDSDVFLNPLEDFKEAVMGAGLGGKEEYRFRVRGRRERVNNSTVKMVSL